MNKTARFLILLPAVLLTLAVSVFAAMPRYFAPILTVLTYHAPSDLTVTIRIQSDEGPIPIRLNAERRAWEWQHRLYRADAGQIKSWFGNSKDLKDAELVFEGRGETKTIVIPDEMLTVRGTEDYVTMDWRTGRLTSGIPRSRAPLIYCLWVGAALLIEGVVFWLYGYRYRKSWIAFLLINLVTQGAQHALTAGLNLTPYLRMLYICSIPVLVVVEMVAFVLIVDELSRDKAISFAVVSNLACQAVLAVLAYVLPV